MLSPRQADPCVHIAGLELSAAHVAECDVLAKNVARAAIELELAAKRCDRAFRRNAPEVTLSLRCCERRLLTQSCGSGNELIRLAQRLLGFRHLTSHCPDRRENQEGMA
jgi:hypothetical protein